MSRAGLNPFGGYRNRIIFVFGRKVLFIIMEITQLVFFRKISYLYLDYPKWRIPTCTRSVVWVWFYLLVACPHSWMSSGRAIRPPVTYWNSHCVSSRFYSALDLAAVSAVVTRQSRCPQKSRHGHHLVATVSFRHHHRASKHVRRVVPSRWPGWSNVVSLLWFLLLILK